MYKIYCVWLNSGGHFYCVLTRNYGEYLTLYRDPIPPKVLFSLCREDMTSHLLYLWYLLLHNKPPPNFGFGLKQTPFYLLQIL